MLPVNNDAGHEGASGIGLLLENYGSQKVASFIVTGEHLFYESLNVLPKGLPLVFFAPNVGALKEWYDKSLRHVEDGLGI